MEAQTMRLFQSSITHPVIKELEQRYLLKLPEKRLLNILTSYGVVTGEEDKIFKSGHNIICDSGAFSLNFSQGGSGVSITYRGYEIYLLNFGHLFEFYFNFDSDFTPEGTAENYRHLKNLEKLGLNPVPVIHDYYGDEIKFYIDQGYEMIALGSIFDPVRKRQIRTKKDIDHAVEKLIRLKPDVKIHLFASASFADPSRWPIYSSDAANWTHNVKFGFILFWNENKMSYDKTDKIFFEDFFNKKAPNRTYFKQNQHQRELEEYLDEKLNLTYEDLMGFNSYLYRQVVNSLYYLEIEDRITEEHKQRGFLY